MRYAHIINNTVVNIIKYDGESALNIDGDLINIENIAVNIGDAYDGIKFIKQENIIDNYIPFNIPTTLINDEQYQ